ncbi:hypothetical protein H310_11599 [Aphanomyces invadans]|uniref:CBM1 domain-containing protein n=1 Tax=Aphanomyces invadans TaxID=157072 RepID=A0A024TMX1_9STRA|nr:hypothetical protein H310_11599 [Aphanomyces invadans]ETV94956.1 hypothetical protein H310_11599 [Aphanomyces invadans]|eukprot:XP_008876547.1 hypothetical protein H310_11599 [Aphanomyces invadans]
MRCRWRVVGLVCLLVWPSTALGTVHQHAIESTTEPTSPLYRPPTADSPATMSSPAPTTRAPTMKKCSPKPTAKKSCAPKTTMSSPPPKKSCAPKTTPPLPPKKSCAPKPSPPTPTKSCAPKPTPTSMAPDTQVETPNDAPSKPTPQAPRCMGFWGACHATLGPSCTQGSTCVNGTCRPVRVGFEQCGGKDWLASSVCGTDLGWTCVRQAPFFAQCLPVATLQCSNSS